MKSSFRTALISLIISSFFCICCDGNKKLDLNSIHDSFNGIKWGENFSVISEHILLERTTFGGNDREPGYQAIGLTYPEFDNINVVIYFQFAKNKLNAVHVYANNLDKNDLIAKFNNLYGSPTTFPSKNTAVWQDNISTIALQKQLMDGGCLFSIVNNSNYMNLTGRMMRLY